MGHVLALDQGTTSSRAMLFDPAGGVRAVAQRELTQHFPRPGWVEHDPEEIWQTQIDVAEEVLAEAGVGPSEIAALGITNQRETTVVWDRSTGAPIHRAIVWQDRRTAPVCDALRMAGRADEVRRKTGLVLDPYFSATKIAWLLDHVVGARARAERGELAFGTVDAWLIHRLTRGEIHATDPGNASRTLLYDLRAGRWDDALLELFTVPRGVLPEVRPSSGVITEASVEGLRGIPIAGVAGDQQAALFGQACFASGQAKSTYGTGCFVLEHVGQDAPPVTNHLIGTVAWDLGEGPVYALEGSIFTAGAVVQWLRDGLGVIETAQEIETLASQVEDTGDVYFVPALTGLGAPHWDAYARGAIVGLTRGTTAAHLARAALEAIAFQVVDVVDAMEADADFRIPELHVDGGAARNDLLLQMQADVLQRPVVRSRVTETTALGAAWLAGLATGVWSGLEELGESYRVDRRFEPVWAPDRAAERRARWSEALSRARDWAGR